MILKHTVKLSVYLLAMALLFSCKKEGVKTPVSMKITGIDVIRYTQTNNGTTWDPTDGPDLTLQIKKGNNVVWTSLIFIENPIYGNVQKFSMQPSYSFDSPSSEYTLILLDEDTPSANELMGEITFTPYDGTENKPVILNLDDSGNVAFKVYVEYVY